MIRHEVVVWVAVLRAGERIDAHHYLPAVADAVAVCIPMAGVRSDEKFLQVGEAVMVEVELEVLRPGVLLGIVGRARVEAGQDLVGWYLRADVDIERVEALEHEVLAVARLAERLVRSTRHPDPRLVPEVVFPAVRELVDVGVGERRVHSRILLGAGLGAPEAEVEAVFRRPFTPVLGRESRLVCVRLRRAEADAWRGDVSRVESVAKAADLEERRQGVANRRIAVAHIGVDARQLVFVRVVAGEVHKVADRGRAVVGRAEQVELRNEDVRYSVLVDVAEVVLDEPFAGEHGLDLDGDVVVVLRHRAWKPRVGGNGLFERPVGRYREFPFDRSGVARRLCDDPRVKVAVVDGVVLVVPVDHIHRAGFHGDSAGTGNRLVVAVVEVSVVDRARRVAVSVYGNFADAGRKPGESVDFCRGERRAVGEDVALAAPLGRHVLLREGAVADARRAVRDGDDRLRRRQLVHVRPRLDSAVLVLDGQDYVLVALDRAEVGRELSAPLVGERDVERLGVLASDERHLDARALARRPRVREVVVDVAADRPHDRVGRSGSARHLPGVCVLGRDVPEHGRDIVDEYLGGAREVVFRPRLAVGGYSRRHDLGLDDKALGAAAHSAVHHVDADADRVGRVEAHVVFVVREGGVSVGNRLVRAVEDKRSGIRPFGGRHRQLDDDVVVGIEVPAKTHIERRARRRLFVGGFGRYRNRRVVEHVESDRVRLGGVRCHVLVLDLELDRPRAGAREVVDEREVVDVRAVGNQRRDAVSVCDRDDVGYRAFRVVGDRAVESRLPVAGQCPLVCEAVLEVVAYVAHVGLDPLLLALRVLVGERPAVGLGLESVEVHRVERRLLVVHGDVEHLRRLVAGEPVCRVVVLGGAEDDREGVVLPAVVGRESVEDGERAVDVRSDGADLAPG